MIEAGNVWPNKFCFFQVFIVTTQALMNFQQFEICYHYGKMAEMRSTRTMHFFVRSFWGVLLASKYFEIAARNILSLPMFLCQMKPLHYFCLKTVSLDWTSKLILKRKEKRLLNNHCCQQNTLVLEKVSCKKVLQGNLKVGHLMGLPGTILWESWSGQIGTKMVKNLTITCVTTLI